MVVGGGAPHGAGEAAAKVAKATTKTVEMRKNIVRIEMKLATG